MLKARHQESNRQFRYESRHSIGLFDPASTGIVTEI
jgi:hypothetical protein